MLALVSFVLLSGCAKPEFDLEDEFSREVAIQDIRNALTQGQCGTAIELSTQLYNSQYSNNTIRMLHASAMACNMGIRLYDLLDQLTGSTFADQDSVFRTMVRLFPSRTALDSKLQSGWIAQDTLQSILLPGTVVSGLESVFSGTHNPGSLLTRDRTEDANTFLVFTSMGVVGTTLNRYGYNTTDDPATLGYAQSVDLPWVNRAAIQFDTGGNGCGLASGLLNMIDSMDAVSGSLSGSAGTAMTEVVTLLSGALLTGAVNFCILDGFSAAQCSIAIERLRYRSACYETPAAASVAAGLIVGINAGWL